VVGGVAETGIPTEIQNIQATPIVAPQVENAKTAETTRLFMRHTAINSGKSFAEQFQAGDTILEIHNLDDFIEFQRLHFVERNTFEGKEIRLFSDILTNQANLPERHPNFPRLSFEFRGKLEGNRHSINGLNGKPLFFRIVNATIQNLNITNSNFQLTSIAIQSVSSIIDNVNVSANIAGGLGSGLVCIATRTIITNSSFNGDIKARSEAGGLVSRANQGSRLTGNTVSGTMDKSIGFGRRMPGVVGVKTISTIDIGNDMSSSITERARFSWGVEFGYSFGFGDYGMDIFEWNFLWGAVINRHFSLYLSVSPPDQPTIMRTNGITYVWETTRRDIVQVVLANNWNGEEILYIESHDVLFPIFLRPRIHFLPNPISPFVDIDVGAELIHGSFYFNPSLGISFGAFNISAGYKMHTLEYERLVPSRERIWSGWQWIYSETIDNRGTVRRPNHGLSLKLGWTL
jgi:hypothetical protein